VTLRLIALAGIALALLKAYQVGRDRERARVLRAMDNALGPTPLGGHVRRGGMTLAGFAAAKETLGAVRAHCGRRVQWLKQKTKTLPRRAPNRHTGTSRLSAGLAPFPAPAGSGGGGGA
jgi:hypothetical protein